MIRVLIAEDQGLVRSALTALLELEHDIDVVAQACDGENAVRLAVEQRPDIAVLDIEMPRLSGLDAAEQLRALLPSCGILILTTFARPGFLQRAMKAQVRGYMLKDGEVDTLVSAIRTIHGGGRAVSPELLMTAWAEENPLTGREQDILRLAAAGMSSREIAKTLFLSEGTVRNYSSIALSKLRVDNRTEAARVAEEKGWL